VDLLEELEMPDNVELDELVEEEDRQRDETEHRSEPAPVGGRAHIARGWYRRMRCNRRHALSACTTARHRGSRSEPESSSKYIQQRWHLRPGARRTRTMMGGSIANAIISSFGIGSFLLTNALASGPYITPTFETMNRSFRIRLSRSSSS